MSGQPVISIAERSRSDPRRSFGLEEALVGVLFGGRSSEREVSLVSGRQILEALSRPSSSEDQRGPRRAIAVEIRQDGSWRVGKRALSLGAALEALDSVDVFFSALHGGEGEDGSLQGVFTCAGKAFTGCGVIASAVAMDKVFAREMVASRGMRVAPGRVVQRQAFEAQRAAILHELCDWRVDGWVVKPRCGGSSVGCSIARSTAELADALRAAFAWEEEALVEALVQGTEMTGGVVVSPDEGPLALPVVEIRPHPGRFFDYQEKYSADGAVELCPPEGAAPSVCERVRSLALLAHTTLRCSGYSRSDFIVPEGEQEPVFLELNTLPGMTPRSLLPRAAAAAGIDYRTLCLWIAAEALRRSRGC